MEANRRFFSKIGFNYFALGIIVLVLNLFIGLFISIINPNLLSNQTMMTFFSAIWTYLLPLPIFIYIMRKTEAKTLEKHKMTVKTFVICISITMFLMWIGNIMGVIITSGIGSLIQHEVANPINDVINNSGLVANLIIITTIAPIFEELIFRKLLIDRTIKYGGTISVLLSGLLFAFFHGNLNQFFLCIPSWRILCNNLYKNRTNQIYNRITYDYKFHRISCQSICLTTINGLG